MAESSGNGNVPIKVVELLVENINELSRQIQNVPSKRDIDRMEEVIDHVHVKVTTPPRNEELAEKLDTMNVKMDAVCELNRSAKWLLRSIWLITIIISGVIILASYVTHFSNKDLIDQLKSENIKIEQNINKR